MFHIWDTGPFRVKYFLKFLIYALNFDVSEMITFALVTVATTKASKGLNFFQGRRRIGACRTDGPSHPCGSSDSSG